MKHVQEAALHLRKGEVVAHPTETCYGLAVDIFQRNAVERLYKMKQMSLMKPVSILVSSLEQAQEYGEFSPKAIELAQKYWPGPFTIVVPRKAMLPIWINPGTETVGFRVSPNKKTRELLESFGGAVTTTSANVHGQPEAYTVKDFLAQGLNPDYILDDGQLAANPPSTIVKVLGNEVELIRAGSIAL